MCKPLERSLNLANSTVTGVIHIGAKKLKPTGKDISLSDVLCAPAIDQDLVSVPMLERDHSVLFCKYRACVIPQITSRPANTVATATLIEGRYRMDDPDKKSRNRNSGVVPPCMKELHETFAHLSPVILRKLLSWRPKLRAMVSKAKGQYTCLSCDKGKMTRGQHPAVSREWHHHFV